MTNVSIERSRRNDGQWTGRETGRELQGHNAVQSPSLFSSPMAFSADVLPHNAQKQNSDKDERKQKEEEEGERMMDKMRRELDRMHTVNRELERRLFVEAPRVHTELDELRRELSAERATNADLRRELGLAVKRSARLAQLLERSAQIHKEQVGQYEAKVAELRDQVRQLNGLLVAKTKSRSIGPTLAPRFGVRSRTLSDDPPAWSPTSASGPALSAPPADQPLGIDAPNNFGRKQRMEMVRRRNAEKKQAEEGMI